ncbi:UDP-N-acetylglucosamine 2-epimerase [Thiohalobacter sp. IOR34]|uniref:UDP-N-acetylglucosamine 2-epimerase n=1 Tax=Thiohalobacter sp. IOR34 TaxID=3057176 RepID=UPI0025AF6582|nr:UDP-N-acetylglucosamine 2-epimerase [Thiohalobacter sp. IOR34]WJW76701.1 UDP-N-acetylglucosamine 2-epimerase [Thiohalobacter sp. IOR34]
MAEIQRRPDLELQVVLGGSVVLEKYGKILETDVVDNFHVNHIIHFLVEGETPLTMAKSAGLAVTEFANAFENLKPDVVIVIADRFECLAIAMAATYMNIPVAHIEGGEKSGSIDESIRHAITKMAHMHFPASKEAAERISRMGELETAIHEVGATSFDVLANMDTDNLEPVKDFQLSHGVGRTVPIEKGKYLIVIQHPVTTEYEKNLVHVNETIKAIHELKMPTFWIWPNMDAGSDGISKGIRMYREAHDSEHVHFFKSLPIELFAPLLKNAACIVGNSSCGIREAAFLGTPAVNIGTRQQGRDRGRNVIDVDYNHVVIIEAVKKQIDHGPYEPDHLYGDGNAAEKIVNILSNCEFTQQKQNTF